MKTRCRLFLRQFLRPASSVKTSSCGYHVQQPHTNCLHPHPLTSQSKVMPAMSSKVSHDPKVFWKVKAETEEFVDQENETTTSPSPLVKNWINLLLELSIQSFL